jgi:hypothetical protein
MSKTATTSRGPAAAKELLSINDFIAELGIARATF